jgi:hypothetical protein
MYWFVRAVVGKIWHFLTSAYNFRPHHMRPTARTDKWSPISSYLRRACARATLLLFGDLYS